MVVNNTLKVSKHNKLVTQGVKQLNWICFNNKALWATSTSIVLNYVVFN